MGRASESDLPYHNGQLWQHSYKISPAWPKGIPRVEGQSAYIHTLITMVTSVLEEREREREREGDGVFVLAIKEMMQILHKINVKKCPQTPITFHQK